MSGANASPTRSASAIALSLKKGRSHQEMLRTRLLSLKSLVAIGFVVSAIVVGLAVTRIPAKPSTITWERDYGKAIERARSEKKLIVADMFTDGCALCKQMDAETFADP